MSRFSGIVLTMLALGLAVSGFQIGNSTSDTAPDFVIGIFQPNAAPADGHTTALATINITPFGGFNGTVSLDDSPLPSGLTCGGISPSSVATSGKAILSCKSSIAGSYWVTIIGTSTWTGGPIVRTSRITFSFTPVPDFSVSATAAAGTADGSAAVSTVTIDFLNGFTGIVTLSDHPPSELNCQSLTPQIMATSGQSSLSCTSRTAGSYAVTVIVSDEGFLVHAATAIFTFASQAPPQTPDVSLLLGDSSISVNTGASGTSTVTVSPQNGFTGSIQLSVSAPNGVTCSFSPVSVQTSGTSILTCNGTMPGDYNVTLTATGGATPHSKTVKVHVATQSLVAPAPPPPTLLGLAPSLFYAIIAIIITGTAAVLVLFMRSRRARSKVANRTLPQDLLCNCCS